jgi:septal ring factor EnvC (AmiA/AmiB activator)
VYDDIRDTRPWFWILTLILFAIAVAGLVVAISAKNSSVDEKQVVNEATAQIKQELKGLNGALKLADRVQRQQNTQAARDRARIRRAVAKSQADVKRRLNKLNKRVSALEGEMTKAEGQHTKLRKNVGKLAQEQEALAGEVVKIKRRLRGIFGAEDKDANGGIGGN